MAYLYEDELASALDAMDHPTRRELLRLLDAEESIGALDLAGRIPGTQDNPDIESSLFQVHLPRLVSDGYVQWDGESLSVERGPNFEDLEPLLAVLESDLGHPAGNRA